MHSLVPHCHTALCHLLMPFAFQRDDHDHFAESSRITEDTLLWDSVVLRPSK